MSTALRLRPVPPLPSGDDPPATGGRAAPLRRLGRTRRRDGLRVGVLVDDPYLVTTLAAHEPVGPVVVGGAAERADHLDVVFVDAEDPEALTAAREHHGRGLRVVAVADSEIRDAGGADAVLVRPFTPSDVRRALEPTPTRRPGSPLHAVRGMLGLARIATVALAAVLEVADGTGGRPAVLALLFTYAAGRAVLRRGGRAAAAADVAVALLALTTTGGLDSSYLLFAVTCVVGAGFATGPRGGLVAAGALLGATLVPGTFGLFQLPVPSLRTVTPATLLVIAGILAGTSLRVAGEPSAGSRILTEANRTLRRLQRLARSLPGGLEVRAVAEAAAAEVREVCHAEHVVVIVAGPGLATVQARLGIDADEVLPSTLGPQVMAVARAWADPTTVRSQDLPSELLGLADVAQDWVGVALTHDGLVRGALLASSGRDGRLARSPGLAVIAHEAGLALDNAELFDQVRSVSVDHERRRLAMEVHDGLAQLLTHLRMELQLLARGAADDAVAAELTRLARVASRASQETRSVIAGLRPVPDGEGLVAALRSYVRDLQGVTGGRLLLSTEGEAEVPPSVAVELFRLCQEAISNALRHGDPTLVRIRVEQTDGLLVVVEDDGRGFGATDEAGQGLGLHAMRERAGRIGAVLHVGRTDYATTRVAVQWYPQRQEVPA